MNSSGLALLMELCRSLRPFACPLSLLIASNSQPERVFKIGKLDLAATVVYDLEAPVLLPALAPAVLCLPPRLGLGKCSEDPRRPEDRTGMQAAVDKSSWRTL